MWKFNPLGSSYVSFSLKEKVLTWSADLRGGGNVYVLGLFTRDLQSSFSSFKREGVFLLEKESLI